MAEHTGATADSEVAIDLPPIVGVEWLTARRDAGEPVVVADVRSYLDGRVGHDAYLAGHLPGAVFVDLDTVLAAPATAEHGRHPLPDPEVFAAGLAAVGIGPTTPVVAYDDLGGMIAGRLVWTLRILGSPAALLDGGLDAWDGPLETGPADPAPEEVEHPARPWPTDRLATIDEVAALAAADDGVVVDSRAVPRYRGETEPIDPRAGHVPGATNRPFADNLGPDGRFLPAEELAAAFADLGADPDSVFYCGSGVSACHNLLALEAAGLGRARLFVGSWSQWSNDPDRPAATGPTP